MLVNFICAFFFFFNDTATTEIYTLSLHDALPISSCREAQPARVDCRNGGDASRSGRPANRRAADGPPPDAAAHLRGGLARASGGPPPGLLGAGGVRAALRRRPALTGAPRRGARPI